MTPQAEIARLDRHLKKKGSPISLRRGPRSAPSIEQHDVPAFVGGLNATDVVAGSGVTQQERKVILSPTNLSAAWIGAPVGRGDWCAEAGSGYAAVIAADFIRNNGIVVRIELQVKGSD